MTIRKGKINYLNAASVADGTKDIKYESKPLSLAVRRLTVNFERGTSELGDRSSQIAGHVE